MQSQKLGPLWNSSMCSAAKGILSSDPYLMVAIENVSSQQTTAGHDEEVGAISNHHKEEDVG